MFSPSLPRFAFALLLAALLAATAGPLSVLLAQAGWLTLGQAAFILSAAAAVPLLVAGVFFLPSLDQVAALVLATIGVAFLWLAGQTGADPLAISQGPGTRAAYALGLGLAGLVFLGASLFLVRSPSVPIRTPAPNPR